MVDNVRLNVNVEKGAIGGPKFQTTVLTGFSGVEQRNIDWLKRRGEWTVGYGTQSLSDLQSIINLFHACRGRAYAFRFKDWSDYSSDGFQPLGTGDGATTTFQIVKVYDSGVRSYTRTITKPVSGTVTVKDNGSTAGTNTINYSTGVITFSSAPASGHVITASYEFDVPVRFDVDALPLAMEIYNAGGLSGIKIVEVNE